MNIVFFGSGHYAPIVLRSIVKDQTLKIPLVVTGDLIKKGPAQLTASLSRENKLPLFSWTNTEQNIELINKIKSLGPDFLVVADFGHRKKPIPAELLALPRFGAVNIHPSLLPKYRGTTPVQTAIINGDRQTGVSLILMDDKFDHGPLIAQTTLPLGPTATSPKLYEKLFELGARMLPSALRHCEAASGGRGNHTKNRSLDGVYTESDECARDDRRDPSAAFGTDLLIRIASDALAMTGRVKFYSPPKAQDETKATYTKMLKKETGRIDWTKSPLEIERMIRAYSGWPGSWTTLAELCSAHNSKFLIPNSKSKRVKIVKAHLSESNQLVIDQLQIEGKKPISWEEFGRGYLK
ncbi:MAG: methionyl-tRNA formyltransferase [Patescibacteria group bacterium]